MSALLHQELDALAGTLLEAALNKRTLTIQGQLDLAAALQSASARARAIEGANVVPWPRAVPMIRAVHNSTGPEAA